jgi:hypothetical protein
MQAYGHTLILVVDSTVALRTSRGAFRSSQPGLPREGAGDLLRCLIDRVRARGRGAKVECAGHDEQIAPSSS